MRFRSPDDVAKAQDYEFDDGSFVHSSWYDVADGSDDGPQAFIVDYTSGPGGTVIEPHFHHVRQFQVIIAGDGARLGKLPASPITFHYTDPDSPYGPIVPGRDGRVAFFTLRPRRSNGLYYMPSSKAAMKTRAGRNILRNLPVAASDAGAQHELIEPHEDGLAAFRVVLAPGATAAAPTSAGTGGQFLLVCDGSLRRDGVELPRLSVGWVDPDEPAPALEAGEEGADVLVLRFPVGTALEDAWLAEEKDATTNVHGDGPRRTEVPA